MVAQAGVPSTESAMLLKQGIDQMEADIKAGTVAADLLFTSLAEVDAYFFSAKQADGAQVTGVLFRTRVPPFMCFAVAPIVPFQPESVRVINARLPPPPEATKAPASGKQAMLDPRQSVRAERARKAGEAARAASSARAAQDPQTPPGSMPVAPPGMAVPPPLDDEGVPQG
jgi:hypothetical protein